MATATATPLTAPSGLTPYRLTVSQYLKILDAGVLPDKARVELIDGVLVARMTKNDPHDYAVGMLADILRGLVPQGWFIREEKSLRIGRWSRPEPDLIVVRGQWTDFRKKGPEPADLGLLVEVADATYEKDRGAMWHLYAAARIPTYWIVHLRQRVVEVYTNPSGRGEAAAYRDLMTYGAADAVPVVLDGREVGRVAVQDVLP